MTLGGMDAPHLSHSICQGGEHIGEKAGAQKGVKLNGKKKKLDMHAWVHRLPRATIPALRHDIEYTDGM